MKKILKIIGLAAGIFAILVAVASVALHVLLPPEKAKSLVLKQLTTHLKRDVRLGDVSVSVLSGLSVSDLKISESPNFSKGTFLSSDQFSLRLALLPLLFRRVEVRQLVLKHPVVQIVRYRDGKTFNFSDLVSTATVKAPVRTAGSSEPGGFVEYAYAAGPEGAEKTSTEPSLALVISNALIEDGVIHFIDQSPARQSADITALNLKLKNVSLTSPFAVQCSLNAATQGVEAALQLAAEADLGTESVKIKTCKLSSAGSTVALSGRATKLKSSHPSVDLQLNIKEFNLATLRPFVALPPSVRVAGPVMGTVHVQGDDKSMTLAATIGLGSLRITSHGTAQGISSAEPSVNLHVETNEFPVSELAMWTSSIPKTVKLGGTTRLAADISGTLTSSRIAAKWEGANLSILMDDQFNKPVGVPMEASLIGDYVQPPSAGKNKISKPPATLTIQSLAGTLGPIHFQGSGSYLVAAEPRMVLALKSNVWPIQEAAKWVPLLSPYKPAGSVSLDVHASGSPSSPMANGTMSLQNVSAHYEQSELSGMSSTINFTQQDVGIPKLTGKLNGSDFTLKLTAHKLMIQPDVTVDANFTQLDLDKLLPPPATAAGASSEIFSWVPAVYAAEPVSGFAALPLKTSGHLMVGQITHHLYQAKSLDFKWNLTDVTADLSHVSGSANLRQGPGKLQNVDKLVAQSKAARIALFPITTLQKLDSGGVLQQLHLPSLQNIPFDSIKGDYVLKSGVMDIQTFELNGPDLYIQTQGSVGLAGAQPLNMKVVMKLAVGAGGGIAQFLQDQSGRPTLNFTATGSVPNPHVKLDVQEVGQKAIQQIGGQLLKNLGFGGPPTSQPNAAPSNDNSAPPPPPQENPADQLQKAFKGLFH